MRIQDRRNLDGINKMNRMSERRNTRPGSVHPVDPVQELFLLISNARSMKSDGIDKMNEMKRGGAKPFDSDHPVNPVHPVKTSCS